MSALRNTLEQLLEHRSLTEAEASQLLLALTDEAIAPAIALVAPIARDAQFRQRHAGRTLAAVSAAAMHVRAQRTLPG